MRRSTAAVVALLGAGLLTSCSRSGPEPVPTYDYPLPSAVSTLGGTEADDLGRCVASALRIDGGSATSAVVYRTTFDQASRVIAVVDPDQEKGAAYVVHLTGSFRTPYAPAPTDGGTEARPPATDYWIVASDPVLPDPSGFWCSDADTGPQLADPDRLGLLGAPLVLPPSSWTVPDTEIDPSASP